MRTCAVATLRRQHERRLRQVELQRERLHRRRVEPARVLEHAERVAGERRLGEHVDDAKRVIAHVLASGTAMLDVRDHLLRERAEFRERDAGGHDGQRMRDPREVALDRAGIRGIVVTHQEIVDHRVEVSRARRVVPLLDRRAAVQRHEVRELRRERVRVGEKVRVLLLQQRDAQRLRCRDPHARRRPHRGEQRLRHLERADLAALRLDEHRAVRREALERREHLRLEPLLRRLRIAGQVAQQRTAVLRQVLEVEHLRAGGGQRGQQPALARPGEAADDDVAKARRQRRRARRRRGVATSGSRPRAAPRASRSAAARA